jgi:hypothetical protein
MTLTSRARQSSALRILASAFVSGLLLWLALRSVAIRDLGPLLLSVNAGWIIVGLAGYWLELTVRAARWQRILQPVRALQYGQVASALLIGYAANNVLPARLGELFRADLVGRRHGISRLSAVATVVVERMLDLLAVVACAACALLLFMTGHSELLGSLAATLLLVVLLLGAGAILTVAIESDLLSVWLRRLPRVSMWLRAFADGLAALRRPGLLASLIGLSASVWALNAVAMWALLRALGVTPDAATILLLIGASGIASALPSAPAGVGTLQYVFVTVLAWAGLSPTVGFAAALLVQVFLLGSATLAGAALYFSGWARRPGLTSDAASGA